MRLINILEGAGKVQPRSCLGREHGFVPRDGDTVRVPCYLGRFVQSEGGGWKEIVA